MSASLEIFARQSLAQFITIYAEVVQGTDSMTPVELQGRMWEKIKGGPSSASSVKLPWNLVKKVKCQLPFLPDCINYTGCQALKKADGLYVPCGGKCDGIMCQSCAKSEAKFGMLEDRGAPGTYTDPSDKHEITYGTWLAKHDKSIEEVYQMLHEEGFSLVIPEAYLAVNAKRVTATRRPGRPGNSKTKHSDSDAEAEESETEPEKVVKEPKEKVVKEPKEKKEKATKKKAESESDDETGAFVNINAKAFPTQTQAIAEAARMMSEFGSDEEGEVVVTKVATKPEKKSGSDSENEKTKEKKTGSDSEKEKKKAEKPKEKRAEKPKEKAEKPKEKRAEKPEKKAEKPKDKKAEKPKKEETKTKPVETVEDGEIVEEEYEPEDEDITYEGESYILRDGKVVFDQNGEIVGSMEDGKITFA